MTASLPQLLRTAALTIAWLVVLPSLCVLASAIVPIIPWVRIYAFEVVPNRAPWFLLTSLAALVVGILAHRRRMTVATGGLIVVAALTMLAAGGVFAHFLYIAHTNGARIDLAATLSTQEYSDSAGPDMSRIYSTPGGEPLWLDIYRPRARAGATPRPSPVLMAVHGGGFVEGTRRLGAANMRRYADLGWTVISIDYRLARPGRPTWDLATDDVRCALAWTAAHAGELNIDVNWLTLSGASAGGSLALAAAYSADSGVQDPRCGPRMPRVAAVVVKAPLIDARESWRHAGELNPLQRSFMAQYLGGSPDRYPGRYAAVDARRYIRPNNPPTLLFAGADDPLLPVASIRDFAQKSVAAGNRTRLIVFPYSGHDFNTTFDSITNQTMIQVISRFMADNGQAPQQFKGR